MDFKAFPFNFKGMVDKVIINLEMDSKNFTCCFKGKAFSFIKDKALDLKNWGSSYCCFNKVVGLGFVVCFCKGFNWCCFNMDSL